MGFMDKLKELIGEYDEGDDGGSVGLVDAAREAEEAKANAEEGSEEEALADGADASDEDADSAGAGTKTQAAKDAKDSKRKPEGDRRYAEASEQEKKQEGAQSDYAELKAKVEKLEAQIAASKGGKTGLVPAGAATTTDADLKRWREIAGLED